MLRAPGRGEGRIRRHVGKGHAVEAEPRRMGWEATGKGGMGRGRVEQGAEE